MKRGRKARERQKVGGHRIRGGALWEGRGPSLGFLLAFRQLEGGNRLNDAASATGPGLLCYHETVTKTPTLPPHWFSPLRPEGPLPPVARCMMTWIHRLSWRPFLIELGKLRPKTREGLA